MNKQKASRAVLNLWRKNIYRYDPYISPSATFRKWYIGRKYQCVPDDCCQDLYASIKIKYEAFLSALLKVLNVVIYRSSYIDRSLNFSIIISPSVDETVGIITYMNVVIFQEVSKTWQYYWNNIKEVEEYIENSLKIAYENYRKVEEIYDLCKSAQLIWVNP